MLTSCLTGLDWSVLKIKTKIVSCHTTDSTQVKQEANGIVILHPEVFPDHRHMLIGMAHLPCFFFFFFWLLWNE
jgi:hypothetical protein